METKAQLAAKFSGPSTLLYQSDVLEIISGENSPKTFEATPELDVPCKVDTLNFEQGEAEVEEYNIFGLSGAWITDSEPGTIDIEGLSGEAVDALFEGVQFVRKGCLCLLEFIHVDTHTCRFHLT